MDTYDGCALKHRATQLCFMTAIGKPIMLVGEGPGEQEDKQGKPFVRRAGRARPDAGAIGLDRTKVFIANMVPWRPPKPQPDAGGAGARPFLRQVELVNPKILVTLGNV